MNVNEENHNGNNHLTEEEMREILKRDPRMIIVDDSHDLEEITMMMQCRNGNCNL